MLDLIHILRDAGLDDYKISPVQGGDISRSYRITNGVQNFFLKVNSAGKFPEMFEAESAGLKLLAEANCILVPEVITCGTSGDDQYLVMEWMDVTQPGAPFWKNFGRQMAALHRHTRPYHGLERNNYIGSLKQDNRPLSSWNEFYGQRRILPLVERLAHEKSLSGADVKLAEALCGKLRGIFPDEPSALIHGDLWSGNFMCSTRGAAIFDPAVYFGHREMDHGMSLLFGGFNDIFYEAYNESYPLEKNWRSRTELTQLYPILVHAVLFGGHYISAARKILSKY